MMHSSLIKQISITTEVLKSSHIKRLIGHMYTEYDYIRCDPPSSQFLTGRAFHNILLFAVQRVGALSIARKQASDAAVQQVDVWV